jgi:uncharacterized protein (TIGR02246 family)
MRSTRTFLATLVAGAFAACTPVDSGPTVDLAAEAQAIRDLSMQWMQAVQAQDAGAVSAMFTTDGTTIFDGEMVVGPAAIQASQQAEFSENPDVEVSWGTNAVTVAASGDMAYERGSWTADFDGAGEMPPVTGEYVTVWVKVDGAWKVAVDAGSQIPPMDDDEDDDDGDMEDDDADDDDM